MEGTQFLIRGDIRNVLSEKLKYEKEKIVLASAFIKSKAFIEIAELANDECQQKVIITRWKKADLVARVSDLEVYLLAKRYGWTMYMDRMLHAKVYQVGSWSMVGSANLTYRGLWHQGGNTEACLAVEGDTDINVWLDSLLFGAREMDDLLFFKIQKEVEMSPAEKAIAIGGYSSELLSDIENVHIPVDLFTKDLFWLREPKDLLNNRSRDELPEDLAHDLGLLDLDLPVDKKVVAERLQISKAWRWLVSEVTGESYFGELTDALHETLLDDPAVYRKDVKSLLQNLLGWGCYFLPDQCKVDRPNYSQRVRIVG